MKNVLHLSRLMVDGLRPTVYGRRSTADGLRSTVYGLRSTAFGLRTLIAVAFVMVLLMTASPTPVLAVPFCCPRSNGGICCGCTIKTEPGNECSGDYDFRDCELNEGVTPCPAESAQPSSSNPSATSGGGAGAVALPDPLSGANFPQLVGNAIRTIMGISGSVALLMFVFGGIQYIMSGGDSKKVSAAMAYIRNASFGLILIFGAYAIASVIFDALLATQ